VKILALDIATRFGYALWDSEEGLVTSGHGQLPSDGTPGKRFAAFHLALRRIAPAVHLIAYEDAWHQKGHAGAVFGGLLAMVQVHAYQVGAALIKCPVATVKKHATGDGRADKAAMMKAATARWGVECTTDDHGDALCVLSYALSKQGGHVAKAHQAAPPVTKGEGRARGVRRLRSEV
jgi:Holliday junction resolvasome RuvABC endonuclease subunit